MPAGNVGEWEAQTELYGGRAPEEGASELREAARGWQAAYLRHKLAMLALLATDLAYLIALLAVSSSWDRYRDPRESWVYPGPPAAGAGRRAKAARLPPRLGIASRELVVIKGGAAAHPFGAAAHPLAALPSLVPAVTGVARYFVGANPKDDNSVTFIVAAALTDVLAGIGVVREISGVMTLFFIWSGILLIFGVLELTGFFVTLRAVLVLAAFQLRFSLAAVQNQMPPTNLLLALGAAVAGGVAAAARFVTLPCRAACCRPRRHPRGAGQQQELEQQQQADSPAAAAAAAAAAADLEGGQASPAGSWHRSGSPAVAVPGLSMASAATVRSASSSSGRRTPARREFSLPPRGESAIPLDDFATLMLLHLAAAAGPSRPPGGGARPERSGGSDPGAPALIPMVTVQGPPP